MHGRPGSLRSSRVRTTAATVAAAVFLIAAIVPAATMAATTTTTLEVPAGTQYGWFRVTAHVRPAPQQADGFTPAVEFYIGGVLNAVGPLDPSGDAEAEFSRPPGTYQIVAKFGPFHEWDASQSAPGSVRVGVGTQVTVSSSRNPAEDSQSVTIEASVSPASVSGGSLSIVDAFDGSTIASDPVGPGQTSVSVTRTFAAGSHSLTASYTGDGDHGPSQTQYIQTVTVDGSVDSRDVGVVHKTFYPHRDEYLDSNTIHGTLGEPARVRIRFYSPSGGLLQTESLGSRPPGRYEFDWTGRTSSGAVLPEGSYRVEQRLTDLSGNVRTVSRSVTVSRKRLVWTTSTITRKGSRYDGFADTGNGSISTSRSAYADGVRLSSGTRGVAVNYRFTLHSALAYGNAVTFEVHGRSPNGKRAFEGLWHPRPCSPVNLDCYDTQAMGPGYAWWSIDGGPANISGGKAYGAVIVPYTGSSRIFDVAAVRLVYRWAKLGY